MRAFGRLGLAIFLLGSACSFVNDYDEVRPAAGTGGSMGDGGNAGHRGGSDANASGGSNEAGASAEPTAGASAGGDIGSGGTHAAGGSAGAQAATGGSDETGNGGAPLVEGGAAGSAGETDGAEGGAGGGAGALTPAAFVSQFLPGLCQRALYCESKLGFGALLEMFCHPAMAGDFLEGFQHADLGTSFDSEQAQQCLDALAVKDCSVYNTLLERECDFAFAATKMPGESCIDDSDCANGYCQYTEATCGGTCVTNPGVGESCAEHDCAEGLYCPDGASADRLCQPIASQGDACTSSNGCPATLWCDTDTNTCEPLPNVGEYCDLDFGGDPCRGSLVCDTSTTSHVCKAGAALDQACGSGKPCRPGLRCSDTLAICVSVSGPGGPCESKENCPAAGFECIENRCEALPVLGEHCDALAPCVKGQCNPATTLCESIPDGSACDGSNGTSIFASACAGYCGSDNLCAPKLNDGSPCEDDWVCGAGSRCLGPTDSKLCVACSP